MGKKQNSVHHGRGFWAIILPKSDDLISSGCRGLRHKRDRNRHERREGKEVREIREIVKITMAFRSACAHAAGILNPPALYLLCPRSANVCVYLYRWRRVYAARVACKKRNEDVKYFIRAGTRESD